MTDSSGAGRDLAEREGKPIALAWIDRALPALHNYLAWLAGGDEPAAREVVASALATNFSLVSRSASAALSVWRILGTLSRARAVITGSDRTFFDASANEARAHFGEAIPPAYAIFERGVFFTPAFAPHDAATGRGFGPLCRAAMVVHESVHVVDRRSGEPAIHISEWDEPRFSAQTVEESIHNPSSYASLCAQIDAGAIDWPRSARYGAGRPTD